MNSTNDLTVIANVKQHNERNNFFKIFLMRERIEEGFLFLII